MNPIEETLRFTGAVHTDPTITELINRINQFRNGHLLRVQVMTRSNENLTSIQNEIEETTREWIAICDEASLSIDTVPLELYIQLTGFDDGSPTQLVNPQDWFREWYQKINTARQYLHSSRGVDMKTLADQEPSQQFKSRPTWSSRVPPVGADRTPQIKLSSKPQTPNTNESPPFIVSPGQETSLLYSPPNGHANSPSKTKPSNLSELFNHSKRNVDIIREQCKQASIAVIEHRSNRDKLIAEVDLMALQRSNADPDQYFQQGLALLEQLKTKYLTELDQLQKFEAKYKKEADDYAGIVMGGRTKSPQRVSFASEPIPHTPYASTPKLRPQRELSVSQPITPSQIEERRDQQELLNTFERLSSSISKHKFKKLNKNTDNISQPDFNQQDTQSDELYNTKLEVDFRTSQHYAPEPLENGTDDTGVANARRRLQEKMTQQRIEQENREKEALNKQNSLNQVYDSQHRLREKSVSFNRSHEDFELQEIEDELNLKSNTETDSTPNKLNEARRKAGIRIRESRLKAEEQRRREATHQEHKKSEAFKKRNDRLERFKVELSMKEELTQNQTAHETLEPSYRASLRHSQTK